MDNENKYPVLYYDMENMDSDTFQTLSLQLCEYFAREKVHFILLPKQTQLKWCTKDEIKEQLLKALKEVETWE